MNEMIWQNYLGPEGADIGSCLALYYRIQKKWVWKHLKYQADTNKTEGKKEEEIMKTT